MADRPPDPPTSTQPPGAPTAAPSLEGAYRVGRVTTAASPPALVPFEARWAALAAQAPQRLPMLTPTWVRAFWRSCVEEPASLRVHLATSGDRLVGVLPVVERRGRAGPRLAAPHDDHTKAGDVLLAPDVPAGDLRGLVEAAWAHAPGALSLTLAGVRDTSPTLAALAASGLDAWVVETDDERGSFAPIAGVTPDAMRASLPDNFRRNLRKAGNRLAREAGVTFRFDAGRDASPAALDALLALEQAGWKGRAGTAIARHPRLVAFYRDLCEGFAARGELEWHTLAIGGAPAAMHLGVRLGRALVLLKIAYDERFARLGPGNLLFERLLERELAAQTVDEVNCTTDMAWHRNWALPRARYARVTLFPRRPLPWVAAFLPAWAKARAKRVGWLRRLVDRARRDAGAGDARPAGSPDGDGAGDGS